MKLEFMMEYTADLKLPIRTAGDGPFRTRGLAVVTGGSFEGPRLKGGVGMPRRSQEELNVCHT